jgi:hypothetical protein
VVAAGDFSVMKNRNPLRFLVEVFVDRELRFRLAPASCAYAGNIHGGTELMVHEVNGVVFGIEFDAVTLREVQR